MMKIKAPDDLLQEIRNAERFLVSSHMNPDGDAVGSGVGIARVLRGLGKSVHLWNHDPAPNSYQALPGIERIHVGEDPPPGFPDSFDMAIILECPTLDRTGLEEQLSDLPLLNIDHHMGNASYGKVNWVDTAAPALGEMIHTLALQLGVSIDSACADALFLALATDTGWFRFNNATARAFTAAAALVDAGARPQEIARWLYESRPEGAVRLLGEMLDSLEMHADGKLATVVLSREMFERAGAAPGDSEGLIDYPRSIDGVETAALIRETDTGEHKVSLRSRNDLDVQQIAKGHGGGGHRNAAGFLSPGSGDETRRLVVSELEAILGSTGDQEEE